MHFCRGTVDLICQHKISEDRTTFDLEFFAFLTVNLCTDNVGRQQVRRKLNTAEIGFDEVTQRLDSQRLGQTRHTFQQNVTIAQQADEQALHEVLLAYNHLIHAQSEGIYKRTLALYALLEFTNIHWILHSIIVNYNFPQTSMQKSCQTKCDLTNHAIFYCFFPFGKS